MPEINSCKVFNNNGDTLTIASGGTLDVQAGATLNLPSGGVVLGNISFTGLVTLAAAGRNGAGAITLTGATIGQRVLIVIGAPTAGGTIAAPAAGTFEASITVADQIQQVSASNLSSNTYAFTLAPVAAAG